MRQCVDMAPEHMTLAFARDPHAEANRMKHLA